MEVFDVAEACGSGSADGGQQRAGNGQEFPVAENVGDPDGRIDVVAYASSDVADIPGVTEALVEDGKVDWTITTGQISRSQLRTSLPIRNHPYSPARAARCPRRIVAGDLTSAARMAARVVSCHRLSFPCTCSPGGPCQARRPGAGRHAACRIPPWYRDSAAGFKSARCLHP